MSLRPCLLFVSYMGFSLDVAWRAAREGYQVKLAILKEEYQELGRGIVPLATRWEDEAQRADIIVFDDTLGMGQMAEAFRKEGKKVIGGTAYTDRLEDDREFGQSEMRNAGIATLSSYGFTNFESGIAHIRAHPRPYVLKPCGETANQKKLVIVGEDAQGGDIEAALERLQQTEGEGAWDYILQERVRGIEISVTAFFDGQKFLLPISVNFEHKRLFDGELGPQTGEMGTSMFWSEPNRLFNETLKKMEPKLRDEGYCGAIDINTIVNGDGIFPLEFTCRFGYPTIYIQQEGLKEGIGTWLTSFVRAERMRFPVSARYQVGVQVRLPPFPYRDLETFNRLSRNIRICSEPALDSGIHPQDIWAEGGEWRLAGEDGCPLIMCAGGATMRDAQRTVYERLKTLQIPNVFYRLDIGDRWYKARDADRLIGWGILNEESDNP